jgi:bifunctional DNase/RNase
VLIDDLDAGIYYARLTLKNESKESEIDARPSDCLALALRSRAPIEVQEKVVLESAISKSEVDKLISLDNYLQ